MTEHDAHIHHLLASGGHRFTRSVQGDRRWSLRRPCCACHRRPRVPLPAHLPRRDRDRGARLRSRSSGV